MEITHDAFLSMCKSRISPGLGGESLQNLLPEPDFPFLTDAKPSCFQMPPALEGCPSNVGMGWAKDRDCHIGAHGSPLPFGINP